MHQCSILNLLDIPSWQGIGESSCQIFFVGAWHKTITALTRNTCNFFTISEKLEVLSALVNPINVTNQTFIIKRKPVAPGWWVSRSSVAMCTCTRVGLHATQMDPCWASCQVMSSDALVHSLGRAVEQLAVCLAKQGKVSSWGQSTILMQYQCKALKCQEVVTYM